MTHLPVGSVAFTPLSAGSASRIARLGDAGGLRQFGAHLVDLAPGERSSERHWHEAEDEFLLVLAGTPTLLDTAGATALAPGDALCWRAGIANGHHLENRSAAPVRYLILGSRVAGDICHYPDSASRQINEARTWRVVDASGRELRGGELPMHLRDLPARWGQVDTPAPPSLVRNGTARQDRATPAQAAALGFFTAELLSDTGGLTQFGAFTETLAPGARSSDRHWHEAEDEFLYMLDGQAVMIDDAGPHPLVPGDTCVWPAGRPDAHHVINRSGAPCTYLVAGSRLPADTVHYAELDKLYIRRADGTVSRTRRDGTPLEAS